jgi:hypothetical protein
VALGETPIERADLRDAQPVDAQKFDLRLDAYGPSPPRISASERA